MATLGGNTYHLSASSPREHPMSPDARPLRELLAAGLKEARVSQGLRQEDAAGRARSTGLTTWIRGTIAQAEVGARRFALEEVLLLALAYETSVSDLIAGADTDLVELSPEARVPVATVRALLAGERLRLATSPLGTDGQPEQPGTAARRSSRFPDVLGMDRFGLGDREHLRRPGPPSEAERYAARKLGITPEIVAEAATGLWGRTLDDERDRRLSVAPSPSARSRQARRGHITRDLLTELSHELATDGRRQPDQPGMDEQGKS